MPNKLERFTHRARRVLSLAQEEAETLGHSAIGTQHLLLGLAREREGAAGAVLTEIKADDSRIRTLAIELTPDAPATSRLEIAPETKAALEQAVCEARELGHDYIGTEHFLLAIIHRPDTLAATILQRLEVDFADLQRRITRLLRKEERLVLRPGGKPVSSLIRRRFSPVTASPVVIERSANPEIMHILGMIRDGKITADEGERLLKALPLRDVLNPPGASVINLAQLFASGDKRQLRAVITDKTTGRQVLEMPVSIKSLSSLFGEILQAMYTNEGGILTLDEGDYHINLFIDRPADAEAS
jgi:hypothetical protein